MKSINNNSTSASLILRKFLPTLIWILAFFIPAFMGRSIFVSILKTEEQLYLSNYKQNLMISYNKYNHRLDPEVFLRKKIAFNETSKIYGKWFYSSFDKATPSVQLRNHSFLSHLPRFEKNPTQEIASFTDFLTAKIGIEPHSVILMADKASDCAFKVKAPFKQPFPLEKLKKQLAEAYICMNGRLKCRTDIPVHLTKLDQPLFAKSFGLFMDLSTTIHDITIRYSSYANDLFYSLSYTIPTKTGNKFLLLIYLRKQFNTKLILKEALESFSNSKIKHQFGWTTKPLLPLLEVEKNQVCLLAELPLKFRKLFLKQNSNSNQKPVLKLCYPLDFKINLTHKIKKLDLFLLFYLLGTFSLLLSHQLGRFRKISLSKLISIGFFTGIMFPIIGMGWFAFSFISANKQIEMEQVLDHLENKIDSAEKALLLQKYRRDLINHFTFANLERFSINEIKSIDKMLHLKSETLPALRSGDHFHSIFQVLNDNSSKFSHRQNNVTRSKEISPILTGPFKEALLKVGAFEQFSASEKQRIAQSADIFKGITDETADPQTLSEMLEKTGQPITSTFTPRREFLTTHFIRSASNKPKGILSFIVGNNGWTSIFHHYLATKAFNYIYNFNNYEVSIHFFGNNPYRLQSIQALNQYLKNPTYSPEINFPVLGEALYGNSKSLRINNMHQKKPHLIFTKLVANKNFYILAYATPIPGKNSFPLEVAIILLVIVSIITNIVLATGISKFLLLNLPPFHEAMEMLSAQNYLWKIELNSGDEFDSLAASFNDMSLKLIEKQKMSQLVSKNVIDLVATEKNIEKNKSKAVKTSILFSDIRSFTSITETYPAEEVVSMLNDYFNLMAIEIEKNHGFIDKLIGDAIQAVFYDDNERSCEERAVMAAIGMRKSLKKLNQKRKKKKQFIIDNGIGISSGKVVTGLIGSQKGKLDATVIGRTVQKAEKLESYCKYAKVSKILIDDKTAQKVQNKVTIEERNFDSLPEKIFEIIN